MSPPRAHGAVTLSATLKDRPEDFIVTERLGFTADGGAAHVLLEVEKRERDTLAVQRELARAAGVPARDVGFAGLKDRTAIARQWFTVPATRPSADWMGVELRGARILSAAPHSRKLRRGALKGNHFAIRLTGLQGDAHGLSARLAEIAAAGVPNYFGVQRFGRDGSNLDAVARWASGDRLPNGREARAFVYSAARALLFNAVLAERVRLGSWRSLSPGELVNLNGRASWFAASGLDDTLLERLALGDIHPTGPLVGRGAPMLGEAIRFEQSLCRAFDPLEERLVSAGLEAARRPLRVIPGELTSSLIADTLEVSFTLPAGAYATVVVRECVAIAALPGEGQDD